MTGDDTARLAHRLRAADGRGTLVEAREASGLSLGQVARRLVVSREVMVYYETGASVPEDALRARLCAVYEVEGFCVGKRVG